VTGKTNYFYTLLIEPLSSDSIFLDTFLGKVWQSITFDDQSRFWAKKI